MSAHTPRKRTSAASSSSSSSGPRLSTSSSSSAPSARGKKQPNWTLRAILLGLIAVFVGVVVPWLESIKQNHYVFDHKSLHELVKQSLAANAKANSTEAIFDDIIARLSQDPKIAPTLNKRSWRDESEWMFNNAGGAMGAMYIIHASITEYLIFFGTPVGTEGHTGRHTADDYFHILTGEQLAFRPGALQTERYLPGDQHHLPRGHIKQYAMPAGGCWALELAQGWIPPMMPFGLADTLSSTLDIPTFIKTAWITAREMFNNLLIGKF